MGNIPPTTLMMNSTDVYLVAKDPVGGGGCARKQYLASYGVILCPVGADKGWIGNNFSRIIDRFLKRSKKNGRARKKEARNKSGVRNYGLLFLFWPFSHISPEFPDFDNFTPYRLSESTDFAISKSEDLMRSP